MSEQRAKTFARLVLQGKLRTLVWWVTKQEKGGVLIPEDTDEKTGKKVIDVLRSKHPDARVPDASELENYETVPDFVDLDITNEVVKKVA
jgi:di/tripeptidase